MEYFDFVDQVKYEGPESKNPLAFKFYDAEREIYGKKMKDHLKFAMAWWHTLCADGTDMFGSGTMDKSFGQTPATMEHARAKADAGFEFMQKLGIEDFCFHDADIAPEGKNLAETNKNLDEITDYIKEKMDQTGIKLLWGTANLFTKPIFMNGAGSSNSADVYAYAAAKIKKAIDCTVKLGGTGYVFWGGREGYETLLNTDVKFEQENIANLMHMAVDYARSIGFTGDFYIEPKPQEPMKHQYDYDAATAIQFIEKFGLEKDFKLNIEANHATLAGHTFEHELRVAAINNMLGSVDANQGDLLVGWDTDQFPTDVYATTLAMLEILRAGGFTTGGLNFDSKSRRPSNKPEDWFEAFIVGMDSFALGLIKAVAILEDGRLDQFIEERYASFNEGMGKKVRDKATNLEELAAYAETLEEPLDPGAGKQEYLEAVVNQVLFSN